MIRPARVADLPALREVERAAGVPFRDLGMEAVADEEPPTIEDLATYQHAGRAWVFADEQDLPVAYLLVDIVDDFAHVEQVSVHPSRARQGLGRQLLDTAADWARQQNLEGLTLFTYAEVPWNAPYYLRLGFRVLAEEELTTGLHARREHEATAGLDAWPRVTMLRRQSRDDTPP